LIVRDALFELANVVPSDAVPEIETRYAVGAATLMDDGITNVTRRVVPTSVVTEVAMVETAGPPAVGSSLTLVFAGRTVAAGKPEPTRVMLVTPACPAAGVAAGVRVTVLCARKVSGLAMTATSARGSVKRRMSMVRTSDMLFSSVDSNQDRRGSTQEKRTVRLGNI
jgi:hypothetical protein